MSILKRDIEDTKKYSKWTSRDENIIPEMEHTSYKSKLDIV